MSGEFELIARYLSALGTGRDDVVLGVGDDAALLAPPPDHTLAVACVDADTLGDPATSARDCIARAAAVLGEAGATPAWATLGLTLAQPDEVWLAAFSAALDDACRALDVAVVGGDTTAGDTAISLFLIGLCPPAR